MTESTLAGANGIKESQTIKAGVAELADMTDDDNEMPTDWMPPKPGPSPPPSPIKLMAEENPDNVIGEAAEMLMEIDSKLMDIESRLDELEDDG